ncbi:hypothetical protein B0W81_04730 [Prochlorococcus sp. HOT_208_60]|nr:hypothetical protein B0W81_04730 [Prochlorococcus sp. HOT_208_60]
MEKNSNFKNIASEQIVEDEIDLMAILYFLLRNKVLIGFTTLITFVLSFFYSLNLKKVWEGQFQIVLNSEQESKFNSIGPSLLSDLIGSNKSSNIKTEVGILKSPSVLMPIYELVNETSGIDIENKVPFSKWQSNLDVELQKGTTILNIAYRDTSKEIILPALEKMSLIYQEYAKKNKKRGEALTEKYLINQINLFKEKSAKSIKEAQDFAIDQDMIYVQNKFYSGNDINGNMNKQYSQDPNMSVKKNSGFEQQYLGTILNIETIRVSSANKIRIINSQIKKINELSPTDYESLQYFGSSTPALNETGLPERLNEIEGELVALRTKYFENEPEIIRLLEEKKLTIDLLKSRAIKYLKIAKLEAEATMEAAMRPKEVLLKYREFTREAARDEKTLFALEDDLRALRLQKAKLSDPWQLITQPTLLKNPVAPSKRNISFLALVMGFFLGTVVATYKEKKSDKIYSIQLFEKLLSTSLLGRISRYDQMIDSDQINFLKEFLETQNKKTISFITLEDVNNSYLQNLRDFLMKEIKIDMKINVISSQIPLENSKNSDFTILFTSLDHASNSKIKTLKNRFTLLNIDLKGFILLFE